MGDFINNDLLFRLLLLLIFVVLFGVIIFALWFIRLILSKKESAEITNNADFYIELKKVQEKFHLKKEASYFDDIKRNYIGWTLLAFSFLLPLIDMKSAIVVNILCIIAFAFSEEIAKYTMKSKRGDTPLQDFYSEVKKHENNFPSKNSHP